MLTLAKTQARLEELRNYEILDTQPEEAFDRIARLARSIFSTPIALISLYDEDRQWFKSLIGGDSSKAPRQVALCDDDIEQAEAFFVGNALNDETFQGNPILAIEPKTRFFASAPLISPTEHTLGTICVIDRRQREVTYDQLNVLKDLAGLVVDQLELRRAHRAEENLRLAAEAASRSKSEFLSRMSHEIRTPLSAVIGYADLLLMHPIDDYSEYVGLIRESAADLLQIINDVLDLEKLASGKLIRRPHDFNIETTFEKVRRLFVNTAESKGLEFKVDLNLENESPRHYIGDPVSLRQILFNLVGNALKFTAEGSVKVEARIEPMNGTEHLLVCEVIDTGPGISAGDLGRIFEPFEQVDTSTTRQQSGTGLGLSIARKLAHSMGGSVEAASVEGQGTTFCLRLTLEAAEPEQETVHAQDSSDSTEELLGGVRVLLAEDNKINAQMIEKVLTIWGCDVSLAANGLEAISSLEKQAVDVILLDLHMPVLDGWQTLRKLKGELRLDIPAIALTADAYDGTREASLDAGFDGFVSKPIDWASLFSAINRIASMKKNVLTRESA